MSGVQLPAFAAAAGGLFAENGLDVELVDVASVPDFTLQGFSERVKAVARGDVDFAITAVAYLLAAQSEAAGRLPARFAAVFHQRNPIAGVVLGGSELQEPADLSDRRTAGWSLSWFVAEYEAALHRLGLGPAVIVDTPDDSYAATALAQGKVDVVPTWVDTLPIAGSKVGFPVRAIPLDVQVYASGLVAGDRLPLELVVRMRNAIVMGLDLQRRQPELGLAAFNTRFPSVPLENVKASWSLFERYGLAGAGPGWMDEAQWRETIDFTASAHSLSAPPPERVYRPELAVSASPV